jgi:hypothetical protein
MNLWRYVQFACPTSSLPHEMSQTPVKLLAFLAKLSVHPDISAATCLFARILTQ